MQCPNPKCRLENPSTTLRCDCGYDFESGRMERSYLEHPPVAQPKYRLLEIVAIVLILLNTFLVGIDSARSHPAIAAWFGATLTPAIIAVVAVGGASLFKRSTRRGRAQIVVALMIFVLLGSLGNLTSQ